MRSAVRRGIAGGWNVGTKGGDKTKGDIGGGWGEGVKIPNGDGVTSFPNGDGVTSDPSGI